MAPPIPSRLIGWGTKNAATSQGLFALVIRKSVIQARKVEYRTSFISMMRAERPFHCYSFNLASHRKLEFHTTPLPKDTMPGPGDH